MCIIVSRPDSNRQLQQKNYCVLAVQWRHWKSDSALLTASAADDSGMPWKTTDQMDQTHVDEMLNYHSHGPQMAVCSHAKPQMSSLLRLSRSLLLLHVMLCLRSRAIMIPGMCLMVHICGGAHQIQSCQAASWPAPFTSLLELQVCQKRHFTECQHDLLTQSFYRTCVCEHLWMYNIKKGLKYKALCVSLFSM